MGNRLATTRSLKCCSSFVLSSAGELVDSLAGTSLLLAMIELIDQSQKEKEEAEIQEDEFKWMKEGKAGRISELNCLSFYGF